MGDTITVSILVKAGNQLGGAVQANLNFDPTKLRVKQVIGNTTLLPMVLQNQYNNSVGSLDYAAGTVANFPSGTFTLVQIQFEALAATPGTAITFHLGAPRNTDVSYGGVSVLTGSVNGSVIISQLQKLFLPLISK